MPLLFSTVLITLPFAHQSRGQAVNSVENHRMLADQTGMTATGNQTFALKLRVKSSSEKLFTWQG